MGGRRNTPQPTDSAYTAGHGSVVSPAIASVPVPSSRDSSGKPRRGIGMEFFNTNSSGDTFDTFVAKQVEDQTHTDQLRRDGELPGSENPFKDAKTQFDEHNNNYGPTQAKMFQNADIQAQTILANDTFPNTENAPLAANPDGLKRSLRDAAMQFCQNISSPTILAASRGKVVADSVDRQIYNNERTGWDARMSLVDSICKDAVARRTAKLMDQTSSVDSTGTAANTGASADVSSDWFTDTVTTYRKLACVTNTASGGPADATKVAACQQAVDAQKSAGLRISDFEAMKTVYTQLLFTPQAQVLLGSAGQNEVLKMMTQLDQLDLMLSYKTYELQQKLAMIKAAQLATMVAGEKGSPGAEAPQ